MSKLREKIKELDLRYDNLTLQINKLRTDLEQLRVRLKVLRMKDQGYSNVEIGKQLGFSENEVIAILDGNTEE